MTPIELRQKLHHQLDQLAAADLPLVDDFLTALEWVLPPSGQPVTDDVVPIDIPEVQDFKVFLADLNQKSLRRAEPIRPQVKGQDLLPVVGTWQGDDLAVCLDILHETRSPSKF